MKFTDLFKLSTRMFKARTSRTLLTILGISVGISAILFLVSLGYGLQKTLLEKITTSDSILTLDITEANVEEAPLNSAMIQEINKIDGVVETSPSFQIKAQGNLENLSTDLTVIGVKPSFLRLGGIITNSGTSISDEQKNGIVIATTTAQVYGRNPVDMLGRDMAFTFFMPGDNISSQDLQGATQKVESTEIYKIIGVVNGDENIVYINSDTLGSLNISRFSDVKVKCRSNQTMPAIRDALMKLNLSVSALSDTVDQANKVFGVVQIVLMMFGIIALVVSAIGMFNTMTIALLERTEEIGIMKSIGASNQGVSLMFLTESTIMGFLGGVGGVLMGYAAGAIFNFLINLIAKRFGGQSVSLFYSPPWFIILIIVFAAVVGFSTGIVPARRASKVDPLDALRYK